MNKNSFMALFLALYLPVFILAQEVDRAEPDIFLVDSEGDQRNTPPGKIILGIGVQSDILYKLSTGEDTLQGGLFQKGLNFLDIPARQFFDSSGFHLFELEFKKENILKRREITIEIRLLPLYLVRKRGEAEKKVEFTVSLFIGDKLIYATKKFSLHDMSFSFELPLSDGIYRPFGLIKGTQKPINTVSILDAVGEIYKLAKSLGSKKEQVKERDVERKRQIETEFLKRDKAGDLWQWKALISLETKDGQNEKERQGGTLPAHPLKRMTERKR